MIYEKAEQRALKIVETNIQEQDKEIDALIPRLKPMGFLAFVVTIRRIPSTLSVEFDAVGSKETGHLHFEWKQDDKNWILTELSLRDSKGLSYDLNNPS